MHSNQISRYPSALTEQFSRRRDDWPDIPDPENYAWECYPSCCVILFDNGVSSPYKRGDDVPTLKFQQFYFSLDKGIDRVCACAFPFKQIMELPKHTTQWVFDEVDKLRIEKEVPIPPLADNQCLVRIDAVSLNYGEVARIRGLYPVHVPGKKVPGSDAMATVLAVGSSVNRLKPGARVCTMWNQGHQSGPLTPEIRLTATGFALDGTLRQYAIFPETGLVEAPSTVNEVEGSTLTCAAVTAWNALFGIQDRPLRAGGWLLVQGSGGVSLFAIQFAVAIGANVVATTSKQEKEGLLKSLGVNSVINYQTDKLWGSSAKKLTPGNQGFDHILEVGGRASFQQSVQAIRYEGIISLIGSLDVADSIQPLGLSYRDIFQTFAMIRSVNVGSREQFEAMNRFIDDHQIKPIIHPKQFSLGQLEAAIEEFSNQDRFGKLVIKVHSGQEEAAAKQ